MSAPCELGHEQSHEFQRRAREAFMRVANALAETMALPNADARSTLSGALAVIVEFFWMRRSLGTGPYEVRERLRHTVDAYVAQCEELDADQDVELERESVQPVDTLGDIEHAPGPTGRFPQGKISNDDEGETAIAMLADGTQVRLEFRQPMRWVSMGATDAREFAMKLLALADKVEGRRADA